MLNQIAAIHGTGVAASTNSYESIATANGTGSSGTITFTSIPSTFKHLQIRMTATSSTVADAYLRFNSDSAANYSAHQLRGNGSAAQAYSYTSQNQAIITSNIGQSSTSPSVAVCDVLDYTSTAKNKTVRSLTGYDLNGSGEAILWSGLWYAIPAAITSLSIILSSGTFPTSASFALYGIKG